MPKNICVIPGDGIGPEVMDEAIKILKAVEAKFGHQFEYDWALAGVSAWDDYQSHLPEETLEKARNSDAILFGSVGEEVSMQHSDNPKYKDSEKNTLLGLRKEFKLNINLRPAKVYPELVNVSPLKPEIIKKGVDILVVRELTGGIYFGQPRKIVETPEGKKAVDTMIYTTPEIAKVAHAAFQAAQMRHKKLCSVDKANVLDCSRLWREVVDEVSREYPDVEYEHLLIDSTAMRLITNPGYFDVILTGNMFGDILSDESATLPGSLGLMPSASLGEKIHMYEPSGGSAPDIAGQGIANPVAQIMSAAMMLKYSFGMDEEFTAIDKAVSQVFADGYRTGEIWEEGCQKVGTKEMGDLVVARLV